LSEKEFQELMQAGHGRAMLYAAEHDVSEFREVILDACLRCYSIDPQIEGTRAGYMLELVRRTPEPEFYCDRVLKALREGGDDWNTTQRFRIASNLATEGSERARRAIYDHFDPGPKQGELIATSFLNFDGQAGFLAGAAKIGALLERQPVGVDSGWLWSAAVSEFGEEEALAALREAAAHDAHLAVYLAGVEREPESSGRLSIKGLGYAELLPLLNTVSFSQLVAWGREAGSAELASAADGLLRATNPEEQIRHLRFFARGAYPREPGPLLALARSSDDRLAHAACVAAAEVRHPEVRDFAMALIAEQSEHRSHAIDMLCRNFEDGDHELVLQWFADEADREIRHGMGMGMRELWEQRSDPLSEVRILQALYDRGPCSHCREMAVRRLIELDALSPAMRRECAFDADLCLSL
jgi:hypothetical protein